MIENEPGDRIDARASRTVRTIRKLHSLTGVFPLGVALLCHLALGVRAVQGRTAFQHTVQWLNEHAIVPWLEGGLVGIPLLVHALTGLWCMVEREGDRSARTDAGAWPRIVLRGTGVLSLGFILLHLVRDRLPLVTGKVAHGDLYVTWQRALSEPVRYGADAIGISMVIVHFALGLWMASATWGVVRTAQGRRRATWVCGAVGVALWLVGMNTLWHFVLRCGGVLPGLGGAEGIACGR